MEVAVLGMTLVIALQFSALVFVAGRWIREYRRCRQARRALGEAAARAIAVPGLLEERTAFLAELARREARERQLESDLESLRGLSHWGRS